MQKQKLPKVVKNRILFDENEATSLILTPRRSEVLLKKITTNISTGKGGQVLSPDITKWPSRILELYINFLKHKIKVKLGEHIVTSYKPHIIQNDLNEIKSTGLLSVKILRGIIAKYRISIPPFTLNPPKKKYSRGSRMRCNKYKKRTYGYIIKGRRLKKNKTSVNIVLER